MQPPGSLWLLPQFTPALPDLNINDWQRFATSIINLLRDCIDRVGFRCEMYLWSIRWNQSSSHFGGRFRSNPNCGVGFFGRLDDEKTRWCDCRVGFTSRIGRENMEISASILRRKCTQEAEAVSTIFKRGCHFSVSYSPLATYYLSNSARNYADQSCQYIAHSE